MERIIRVTGKGKLSLRPDTIRLNLIQRELREEYAQAVEASADAKTRINDVFTALGFSKSDLKTTYFNVDTRSESYQAKDKSWKTRFLGYEYEHHMKIEFPADNDRLGMILYAVSHLADAPEFSVEYTVKDTESAKNELLKNAVADSMKKAEVLTLAAGVKRGALVNIDYSWAEVDFVSRPMQDMNLKMMSVDNSISGSYRMDIEAEDIVVTDTVTVVWALQD